MQEQKGLRSDVSFPGKVSWWNTGGPQIDGGRRVYALGDIHGRADLLKTVIARILADIDRFPVPIPELVFLGDYISRGTGSRDVLEFLSGEAKGLPVEIVCLKGNHEDLLLKFLFDCDLRSGLAWLNHGGKAVVAAYDVSLPELDDEGLGTLSGRLKAAMPQPHLQFLQNLKHCHCRGDYLFVHGGIRPGVPIDAQDPRDLMWIRDEFLNHDGLFERFVVHGHTPADLPEVRRNRLNVDTRAYESGVLSCAVLQGNERRFLTSL
ncbi:MAG TPA: metallophosphoesterase [Ensifer sp.]|nr:metallophosphoesterase [Ensifer sp.]